MPTETQWDERYSVGHALLDRQHRQLLRICNELAACVERNTPDSDAKFHEILHELSAYAREHFSAEEALLKRLGFPRLVEHEQAHNTYVETFAHILSRASEGVLDKAGTLMFLAKWWSEHILVSDMAYRPYLQGAS